MILNLTGAPRDPAERLLWLNEAKVRMDAELLDQYADCYAQLRLQGRLEWAIARKIHGRKKIIELTRRWNNAQARMIRWNDSLDPYSSTRVRD